MKRKNRNLAAVTMAATMACGAYARAGQVIGDWQSSSPLITNNPNNAISANNPSSPVAPGQNDGWFDWQASNGGNGDTNMADTITYNNPGTQPGTYFPPPYYTYPTAPAPVAIGTQALQANVYQSGYYQNLSLKTQYEIDGEGNSELADFFDNTEFTVQVTYNAEQWQSTAGIQNGLSINAQGYGFNDQNTNYGNNGFGPPNYDTGNPSNPGNWDATDYASPSTNGITTRTMTFYYGNLLPGGSGNAASTGTTNIPATASYVELILATNTYDTNGTLGDIYFSDAQFTNTAVNTSWQAEQHAQGTPYTWGNDLNFAPFNEATLTGGMPCNAGDTVTFGNDIPTGITEEVDLDENIDFQISVGTMIFDNANSNYLIAQGSGGTLTLNGNVYSPSTNTTTAGTSSIVDEGGNHTISAPVALATTTTVAITSGSVFTMSGNISGTGALAVGPLTLPNSEGAANGAGTLVLSGTNTYSGGTSVSSGKLLIEPTGPTTSALPHGALSISGSGIVQLADNVTAGTPLGTSNVSLTSLSIAGNGTLDIGNNRIIIDYSSPATDPIASIASWIKNGFYDLTGPQIISSDIAADDAASGLSYGIGYADGADGVVAGLPSGEIEVMLTLLGDANLDGTVNTEDFTQFSGHLGQSGQSWDDGDFNYDGTVNTEDFTLFSHNLGESDSLAAAAGTLQAADGLSLANVPEPALTSLLVLVTASVIARRRRSR